MTESIQGLAAQLYGTHLAIAQLQSSGSVPEHLRSRLQMLIGKVEAHGAKVEYSVDALGVARPSVVVGDGVSVPYGDGKLWAEKLVQAELDAAARRR